MTAIYSPQAPLADNPQLAQQRAVRRSLADTATYSALPWALADLPGTEWLAVFTFRRITLSTPDKGYDRYDQLGSWHGARFVIEHWVRWDVLPPYAQLRWHTLGIQVGRTRLAEVQAKLHKIDNAPKPKTTHAKKEHDRERGDCILRLISAERFLQLALVEAEALSALMEAA